MVLAIAAPFVHLGSAKREVIQLAPTTWASSSLVVCCTALLALYGRDAAAQTAQGFNFRSSSSYVADAIDETYDLGAAYPTARKNRTFGWETSTSTRLTRNRSLSVDRRLAGIFGQPNNGRDQSIWRLDLPSAGTYEIRLALGDSFAQTHYLEVLDGNAVVLTLGPSNTQASHWIDTSGVDCTATTWPTSNTPITLTFSTAILRLKLGSSSASAGTTTIGHVRVDLSGPSSTTPTITPTATPLPFQTPTQTVAPTPTNAQTPASTQAPTNTPGNGPAVASGFNFRATSGHVTDATDETYDVGSAYPTQRKGRTFGWEMKATSFITRDRDNSIDRRLAGTSASLNGSSTRSTWRLDLPGPGTYAVRLAAGDASYPQTQTIDLLDDAAVVASFNGIPTSAGRWIDASGVDRTSAGWPSDNVPLLVTISSSILKVRLGSSTAGGPYTSLSHIRVDFVSAPLPTGTPSATPAPSDTPESIATATDTFTAWPTATPTPSPTGSPTTMAPGGPAYGFNFRTTSGFVTDAGEETYVLGDGYPTTRRGRTFGWENRGPTFTTRNRSASIDRRFAGINGTDNPTVPSIWRLDLPGPGTYQVRLAAGDATFAQVHFIDILDGDTVVASLNGIGTAAGHWLDASGVDRTAATWITQNIPLVVTFSSPILRVRVGSSTVTTAYTTISHVRVDQAPLLASAR